MVFLKPEVIILNNHTEKKMKDINEILTVSHE